jgi:hypothetical protein
MGLAIAIATPEFSKAALVFEDDFTGPAGSVEGRSTDGATTATNGTYYHVNANLVYTDGVSSLTGVNPATGVGNFGTTAIDVAAGGDLDISNSIVTSRMVINSNRPSDGGNGSEFGTLFVEYEDFGFTGVSATQSGPTFQFDSLGAPFKLFKPGLPLANQPLISSDLGNGTPKWLGVSNTIEFILNTNTNDYQLKHNGDLVHSGVFEPNLGDPIEVVFWNPPTFDNLFFQFNSRNWVVDYVSLDVTRIPEPNTALLLLCGLGAVGVGSRSRR